MSSEVLMSIKNLQVFYGAIHALKGISFEINVGEIVSLIGSNGAGKTSTLRAICGLAEAQGEILLEGESLLKIPAHERVHLGLAQSPEGRGIFTNLTVYQEG